MHQASKTPSWRLDDLSNSNNFTWDFDMNINAVQYGSKYSLLIFRHDTGGVLLVA
jgi:hypothetical protein